MEPRTARMVIIALSIALIIICILSVCGLDLPGTAWEAVMLILAVCTMIAEAFITHKYWRCSRCGALLPIRGFAFYTAEYCHECGEMIW